MIFGKPTWGFQEASLLTYYPVANNNTAIKHVKGISFYVY